MGCGRVESDMASPRLLSAMQTYQFDRKSIIRLVRIASIPLGNRSVVRFGEQLSRKVNKHGDFVGLGWVDGSYLLFVEPRLVGDLDVVSVRVADVCREVVGTPFGPKARFLD